MSLQTKLQGLVDGKTAVVNSINAKADTSLTVNSKWSDLASAVDGITAGGGGEFEPIVLTGDCSYACAGAGLAETIIERYPNKISTYNITNAYNMFRKSSLTTIPFALNFHGLGGSQCDAAFIFDECKQLTHLPSIANLNPTSLQNAFASCFDLREITDEDVATINCYGMHTMSGIFNGCYSLRSFPLKLIQTERLDVGGSSTYFGSNGFSSCYVLDELVDLPIPWTTTWTSNQMSSTFQSCYRLKNLTFSLDPTTNQPYVKQWRRQNLDLTSNIGYAPSHLNIIQYNSGITRDKEVTDQASYEALKNDPDWYTTNINYSRYNHDSAVATINSLPDTSAYLAGTTYTNTITFKGAAGALTDGGAINTLTEEEIAVATAKGWTVVLQ